MKNKSTHIAISLAVFVCRFALAVTFLFSGFVKAIDPIGMAYKLNAYLRNWDILLSDDSLLLQSGAVFLGTVEFMLGVCLFLGIRRRVTIPVAFLFMLVMTLLTCYIYIYNPVPDCGCFGEAIELSHGETLLKNVVLLLAVSFLMFKSRLMKRLISERNQWLTTIYSLIYVIALSLYSIHYLPPLDFTSYGLGTNLRDIVLKGEGLTSGNADLANFYLGTETEDVTFDILSASDTLFLLTIPREDRADDGCNDRINDLYDYCKDHGISFYAVIDSDKNGIESWVDRTGAAYPFLRSNEEQLRAMVRSNPGLLLFKDGTLIGKWSNNDLPEVSGSSLDLNLEQHGRGGVNLFLWFALPLFLVVLGDSLWIRHKIRKHYKQKRSNRVMRKKIVAGNWKMNKNLQEGVALAKDLNAALVADAPNCDVVICTPFIHLASVASELDANLIGLGAENCADKVSGAYTGEVSAEMVKSTGAQYVILGHSERRAYYHETPEILKEKINLALANGLKVIFCIGEVLEERESGKQNEVVKAQLEGSLFDLSKEEFSNIILAYEPVWAIGTGKTATADQAEEMHAYIRSVIAAQFGADAAENVSILYGGSCKPSNAKEIFAKPNVDGGLIGGAALKVADFKGIIDAWK